MKTTKIKIWMQLLTTIGLALVLVWAGVITWQSHVTREQAIAQAVDYSESMHNATMAGLTGMMVTGTVGERHRGRTARVFGSNQTVGHHPRCPGVAW